MVFVENNKQNTCRQSSLSLSAPLIFVVTIALIISQTAEFLQPSILGTSFLGDSVYSLANQITKLIFPFISASISYSLSGFYSIVPSIAGGYIAGSGATLLSFGGDAQGISGVFGAVIAGYVAGYIVKLTRKLFSNNDFSNNYSNMVSTSFALVLTLFFMLIVNQISYVLNYSGILVLTAASGIHPVLLSVIIGLFMTADCMGPLFLGTAIYASSALVTGSSDASTCINATIMIPALSFGIFCILYRKRLTQTENFWGLTALLGGLFGITLSYAPFYASKPIKSVACCIPGGCVTSALSTLFRCKNIAQKGMFSLFTQEKPLFFLLSVVCGVLISVYMMSIVLISREEQDEKKSENTKAATNITA